MKKISFDNKKEKIILKLKNFFEKREDILMAFIFGSWARDDECIESDVDVGIYLKPENNVLEWQSDSYYENEHEIWREIEKIIGKEVDLVILNRASPTIAESALKGIPVIIKNRNLYINFLLRITSEAIDFREWVESFWKEKERRKYEITTRR